MLEVIIVPLKDKAVVEMYTEEGIMMISGDATQEEMTRAVSINGIVDFTKTLSKKATATITCRCSEQAKNLTSMITLQVYLLTSGGYINTSAAPAV